MQIVIEIDEARYKDIQRIAEVQLESTHFQTAEQIIAKGVPIEREPKTGHWIHFASGDDCSECGWSTGRYVSPSKYCPGCGCLMVEPQESEDKE